MTIKQYIKKHGLQYECEMHLHRAMSIVIAFTDHDGKSDETEFSVTISDTINELDKLFSDFCKENGFLKNTVTCILVVRIAETMDKLVELECSI